ncbi:MAG: GldM family protein [Bacteroidota bacterium]
MSIPKEPRQLMINLMYLVLTALLALNVSAEVMNAFFTLDEGNKASINTVDSQLDQTVKGLKDLLSDESKAKYKAIEPAVDQVRADVSSFGTYIDALRDELVDAAGDKSGAVDDGDFTVSYGKKVPKGKKNKDITTRMLVEDGKGEELKAKILEVKQKMVDTYTQLLNENGENFGLKKEEIDNRIKNIANNLPLSIDDETWKLSKDKKSWADFKFRQMPLAAVMPLLSQMQSDAKSSEAALVNNMAELAGGRVVEFDAFFPVVQAEKSYVIKGEPFKAKISVGTYSSSLNPSDIGIFVDGRKLPVNNEGIAEYTGSAGSVGTKTIKLRAEVINPLTGEKSDGDATYTYEVGERSVAISADKMNVFYIGVDNPISVSAAGVSSNDLNVNIAGGGGKMKKTGSNSWDITVSEPTNDCKINVSGGGMNASKQFRVKRIPDPTARLGNKADGSMGNGEFKAQQGLIAWLDNFDFDAKCQIQGFNLVKVAKRSDPVEVVNQSGRFNSKAANLTRSAKPGDTFYFENVKARCPGDKAGRKINSLVFRIK